MIYSIIILVLVIVTVVLFLKRNSISRFSNTDTIYDMSDITGVIQDQCTGHYDPIIPLESERCLVKFKTTGEENIEKHNNGEICLSACTFHYSQRIEILYKMTDFAVKFFGKYSIEWCFYYGGLVGLYTRKELLPWDPDVDFIINTADIKKLPGSYEDNFYSFNIHQPIGDEDIIGRIIDRRSGLYADITYYTVDENTVSIKKMPTEKKPNKFTSIPIEKFYPLIQTSFNNGLTVPVPKDIYYNLEQRYGKLKDDYKLVNDKYIKSM